ncbi:hypothetical protein ESCO_000181 [Escovopsis weberi]|uniref:Uncharacterized protein n=1 Tax=Escovopsis weberi TaxID=150374 RepID=A0A0M9VU58_ESCWE|nr:hypothetical protein ESCO_000181 [Escovopsis weberi]
MWLKHLLCPIGVLSLVPLFAPAASLVHIPAHRPPYLEARTPSPSVAGARAAHVPTMLFSFTEKCDSASELAEDCRVTLAGACDASTGQWPTCQDGRCQCLAKACLTTKTCGVFRQCRQDDQEPVCSSRANGLSGSVFLGVCGCRPRLTGCLGGQGPNPNHSGVGMAKANGKGKGKGKGKGAEQEQEPPTAEFGRAPLVGPTDWETCKGLVDCGRLRPFCNVKSDGPHSKGEGYCTCV